VLFGRLITALIGASPAVNTVYGLPGVEDVRFTTEDGLTLDL
jgi:hypothetical protein